MVGIPHCHSGTLLPVGVKEKNRNSMLEALIANFEIEASEASEETIKQTVFLNPLPCYEHSSP